MINIDVDEHNLAEILGAIETLVTITPVNELRHLVANAEAIAGQRGDRRLPSGNFFDNHTRKARLLLDLIDDLEELKK